MISKISISGVAAYNQESIVEPKKINFFYGGNGVGKTTLSRLLADESFSLSSSIEWSSAEREKMMVFNHDFVNMNFQADRELPGIFTLGAESIETQEEINRLKGELDTQKVDRKKCADTVNTLQQNLDEQKKDARAKCWSASSEYMKTFASALVGFRGSQDNFFEKCVSEFSENFGKKADEEIPEYDQVVENYQVTFAKDIKIVPKLPLIDDSIVDELDSFDLLEKVITGKADTSIGQFILSKGLGDWVKHGLAITETTEGKCPFCQREMPRELIRLIEDFYDEEYDQDKKCLEEYYSSYCGYIEKVQNAIDVVLDSKYDFIEYDEFSRCVDNLSMRVTRNKEGIKRKIDSPMEVVKIKPLREVINEINLKIKVINEKIQRNNEVVADRKAAKEKCQSLVWRYIVDRIRGTLSDYIKKRDGIQRGIKKNNDNKRNCDSEIGRIEKEIQEKEKLLTTVKPTVDSVNGVLKGLGFDGFALQENSMKPGTYSIVRPDGRDVGSTLSEGEHNFIAFLYFYYLCFGSQTKTGITNDRIIVIDDPISSLDSNVLYVVASLVKMMISNCRKDEKGIRQVFVLTHNVYFHKEVTYLGRASFSPKEVTFNVIRKIEGNSTIVNYQDNPIKTSYQILWDELRNPSMSSITGSLNAMRRILEHYFQVMGGINYEECINSFEGADHLLCRSLIAYINDGSHSIFDDLTVSTDEASFDSYLRVFRRIFELFHHIDHYNMMMGIEDSSNEQC